ncbi:hypothetical protein C8Q79DRAFT_516215 [Trametes meyenii]|nr:hypothetical protein C8Q79DRAFT_516215 [Trametes meyenii]
MVSCNKGLVIRKIDHQSDNFMIRCAYIKSFADIVWTREDAVGFLGLPLSSTPA